MTILNVSSNNLFDNENTVMYLVAVIRIVLIVLITVILRKLTKKYLSKKIDALKENNAQYVLLSHVINGLLFFVGSVMIFASIPPFRDFALSIFAGSGVLALIIGFASQETFSNIISGFFITIFKPFRVGDRITFIGRNCSGIVEDITFRHTVVRTFENKRIIIPNSLANKEMIENANLVEEKICNLIEFDISYDSDIDKAIEIIREEIKNHPLYFDNRSEEDKLQNVESVPVRLIGFFDSSMKLRAWAWALNPANAFIMKCDIHILVKKRFDKEGIEIPYPYRTIVFKDKQQ